LDEGEPAVDRPYDEVARSIIAASAKSNHVVAAANVIAREHVQGKPQPDDGNDLGMVQQLDTHDELATLYAKTFLGVNLSCVSCHDGAGIWKK
jgi:cytochrome c